jgi:hypothetical protein
MVDGELSSTTPELLPAQAIELEMPAPRIWGRPRTGPSNNWLDASLGTFPRPEVPACAMTLPLLAHAGFVLHAWGESLGSAMKVPVSIVLRGMCVRAGSFNNRLKLRFY